LIRKITPLGEVTTFAGAGGVGAFLDGAGTAAKFNSPQGLAIDSANNLYVADFGNNRIRKIDSAGNVTTIAGTGTASSLDGAALSATMRGPTGIAVDSNGTVYWTDKTTSIIRKLQGGQVTTLAGSSGLTGTTNGTGSTARFNLPTYLTLNNAGNLVVNDATNLSYRQITPAGVVTTLFNYPSGGTAVGVDAQGNLYAGLSSNTLSLISSFDTTTIMGTGTAGSAIAVNTAATVGNAGQMVFLSDGTIVIADNTRNNIRVGTPIPSLMNPGKQIVLADQLLTFDNAALEGLGIQSNGYPEPLSITLTVTKGIFSLSQTTGLTFTTGDGTNDTTMTFTGTMANINAALTGLVYNFDEVTYPSITADTLTISTPYTVGGVTSTISQVVPIQIVKPPVITAVADKLVNLGTAIPAATFTVTDADTAANALTYTITSSNTALVPNSGLVRTGGTGATGTTVPANAANSLAITAVAGRTGTTTITISVFDGIITTTTSFLVIVSPIVGAPDLLATSDTGTSSSDNLTSDTTPTFAVSIGSGSGIQVGDVVAIYNGTTKIGEAIVTAADITAGSIQVTTSALADGNYSNITSSVIFGTTRGAISAPLSPALVIDATAPSANGLPDLNPASDTGASSTDNVTNDTTPTFNIPLTGTGAVAGDVIQLYNGSTLIGTYTLTAGDITANGASLTTSTLPAGTYSDIKYRFVDTAGNTSAYSGSMSPALVIDLSAPTLVTLNPADDSINIQPPTTLVMTLSEALSKGTGSIVIKKTSDNSIVETFNVATSGRVMISNSTVTITPSVTLAYGTGYYVTVANTALLDLAGKAYAGLANTTDCNFTTLSTPPSPTGVDLVSASDSGSSSTDNKTNKTDITLDVSLAGGSQVGDVIKLYDGTTVVGTVTLTANDISSGKVSFNLISQTDGTHNYTATLSNAAGESTPTSVLSTIIDTSLPGAPTVTPVGSPTSNTTPTLTGTAEAGAKVTLVIDGISVTVTADSSGNWTYTTPTALAEGSHTVVVTQTDVAGNIGTASTTTSFVIDTTAPTPVTFSPADGTTVSKPSVLSITFNEAIALGSNGTITIFDDTNNTSQVITLPNANITVNGNALTIVPTTSLSSGTNYHVEISSGAIKDLAGNAYAGISNSTDWNFTTNNAPSSPSGVDLQSSSDSGTSNSDNKTNATTLNFDVPIPAGASVGDVIELYDGTTLVGSITLDSTILSTGTVTFNLTGVTSGSHNYTSTLTNTSSGLTSSPSPALVVDVSTTIPTAPVITPLAITKNQTPTISGTAPANSTVTLTIGTGTPLTIMKDANGNWTYPPTTPLAQGTYVLSATATDVYGNISLASAPTNLVIDTTAPTKPIITGIGPDNGVSTTDKITSANVLTLTGTAEANSVITVYDNGNKIGTTTTDSNGVWTFITPTLADGSNRFSANATDAAGNKSVNADSYTMVVDASAPTAPVINSLPSPNGDNTPTISGTGEPGAVVTINANGSPIGTAVVDANGYWNFTPTTPISDGTTAFTAIQKDTAGNTSPTSNSVNSVIDTTAPNAPLINDLGTINSATPAITGTAEPGSTIKLYDGTTLIGTATADSNGNWTITPSPALNEGTNNLIATATDPSGNISPTSNPVVVAVDTVAPIATSFSPATGSSTASVFDNLVINFSEPVVLGSSGTIELRDSNGVLIESFSFSSNRLTLSGNSLTIDPTANLTLGTGYYVTMTAGTIKDLAGNAFAGVTNNSDWAFTTSSLAIPPAPSGVNLQPGSDTGSSNTDNITSDNTPTLDIAL
ncbi:MAG: Ig-like domain-containing protein, partial [Planctomycetia bacterium]